MSDMRMAGCQVNGKALPLGQRTNLLSTEQKKRYHVGIKSLGFRVISDIMS